MFIFLRNFVLPFTITFLFLFQALKEIDYTFLLNYITTVNPLKIIFSLLILLIDHSFRVIRWKLILAKKNTKLTFLDCFNPYFISLSLNNILPLRSGDVYRCLYFKNKEIIINSSRIIGSILIERVFDLLIILIFFFFGYLLLILNGNSLLIELNLINNFLNIILIFFLSLVFILFVKKILINFHHFSFLKKIAQKLYLAFDNILKLIKELIIERKLFNIFLLTLISWFFEGLFFLTIIDKNISFLFNWFGSWFVMAFATLSTLIPSSPGYIGTFHYFTIKGLQSYGMPSDLSSTYSFLIHGSLWIPLTGFGLAIYFINKVTKGLFLKKFKKLKNTKKLF